VQTFTIEISIPEELLQRFQTRLQAYHGDTREYVQEVIARDLFAMSDPARQKLIDTTFEAIDQKYGEALVNLAK
jgi:ABC-type phosphonate transport system ATPase subunit